VVKILARVISVAIWSCLSISMSSTACTVSEDLLDNAPFNSDVIPNEDRIKIAEMVIRARQWPDAGIRGIVTTSAYIGEANPQALALRRAANLKEFLIQLGVRSENIWSDTHIISNPYPKDSAGYEGYLQIGLTLVPFCNDGCRHLCSDPHITPTSRALR